MASEALPWRRLPHLGLRASLILLVAVATLPLALAMAWEALSVHDQARQAAREAAFLTADLVARGQTATIDTVAAVLDSVATRVTDTGSPAAACPQAVRAAVSEQAAIRAAIANLALIAPDGQVLCSSLGGNGVNVADRDYFLAAMGGSPLAIGRLHVGGIVKGPTVAVARPVRGADRQVQGVVAAALDVAALPGLLGVALPPGTVYTMFDGDGIVIARQPDHGEAVGRRIPDELMAQARGTPSASQVEATGMDGVPRLYAFRRLPVADRSWWVAVGIDRDRTYGVADRLLARGLILFGASLSSAVLLAWWAAHSGILSPVRRLARSVGEASADDIGGLAAALSELTSELSMRRAESEHAAVRLARDAEFKLAAEDAQRRSARMLDAIVSALPVAIFSLDRDGNVALWNSAAMQILGFSALELVGQRLPPTIFERGGGDVHPFDQVLLGEMVRSAEIRCHRGNGQVIEASFSGAPLCDEDGHTLGVICVIEDISQRKALAAQLLQAQKMEAVGQLTGGIAHDFNNLLGVAIGNLDLVSEELDEASGQRELVDAALGSLLKGVDLTRALLAFARRQPLQPVRVDIEERMAASVRLLRRALGEQIELSFRSEGALWPVVVDPAQLEAAITNLAINARDAMPEGGRLVVGVRNTVLDEGYAARAADVRPGDYVIVEVSDTGHGMPPEVLVRVFEPFFTTKPPGKGTGLGLSMVYGFIRQSGGHVRVYSEVGVGTTIRLYLPRAPEEAVSSDMSEAARPVRGGDETILVVEDDAEVRKVVMRQLADLGYRLIEAEHAPAALDLIRGGAKPDLLFTDVVMPQGINGFELAHQARALHPGLKVLFTSGFPSTTFTGSPQIEGEVDLLSKPYRKQDLARRVRAVLDLRSAEHGQHVAGG